MSFLARHLDGLDGLRWSAAAAVFSSRAMERVALFTILIDEIGQLALLPLARKLGGGLPRPTCACRGGPSCMNEAAVGVIELGRLTPRSSTSPSTGPGTSDAASPGTHHARA